MQVVAFFGAKGGAGATSLAINTGGFLASMGHEVLLVDMDLQVGCAADSLGLQPQRSLAQVATMVERGESLSGFPFARHASGLYLVDQPDMAELDALTAESLPRVFAASGAVDYIVVDGLRDFTDHAIELRPGRQGRGGVQSGGTGRFAVPSSMTLFRRLGYGAATMTLVMNRQKSGGSDVRCRGSGAWCPRRLVYARRL